MHSLAFVDIKSRNFNFTGSYSFFFFLGEILSVVPVSTRSSSVDVGAVALGRRGWPTESSFFSNFRTMNSLSRLL